MTKRIVIKGMFQVCAGLVIAMLPIQFGYAQTVILENDNNLDSEIYIYESENGDTSSWRSRWEQQTLTRNGETTTVRRSQNSSDNGTSDWRSSWTSRGNSSNSVRINNSNSVNESINLSVSANSQSSGSDWRSRWSSNRNGNDNNDNNDDTRNSSNTSQRSASDWRSRWQSKTTEMREDWQEQVTDWRQRWTGRNDSNNGHGNDPDDCDESNPGNSWNNRDCDDDDNTTRAEAQSAINRAETAIDDLEDDIEEMEDDNEDQDEIDEANEALDDAQSRLNQARSALQRGNYNDAKKYADEAVDIVEDYRDNGGNDDDDDNLPEACRLTDAQLDRVTNFPPEGDGPIVAFGDSLTAGVGASSGQDYVSELERLIGEDIINAGVRGDTTEEALARLDQAVLSHDPRAVIVWLGGNDILARYFEEIEERAEDDSIWEDIYEAVLELFGREPNNSEVLTENETFRNLETIVERIHDSGAVVILVGIDGEPLDNDLNDRYEDVARATGAIFIDDVLQGIIGRSSLTSDFIHPNNAGYEIVAERIYPAVACIAEDTDDDNDSRDDNNDNEDDYTYNDSNDWRSRWGSR